MFHAYGAYVVLLREEFGWSKTMLSAAFSMARAESGFLGPVHLRRRLRPVQVGVLARERSAAAAFGWTCLGAVAGGASI